MPSSTSHRSRPGSPRPGPLLVVLVAGLFFALELLTRSLVGTGECGSCLEGAVALAFPGLVKGKPVEASVEEGKSQETGVEPDLEAPARLVAIGDVHGDHTAFTALLRKAGLVGEELRWAGGKTVFVQTGDLLDRGPDSRKSLDLMMRLEKEAPREGGRVMFIPGNHEIFNLVGDLRYLHERELDPYAAEETSEMRARRLEGLLEFLAKEHPRLRSGFYGSLDRKVRTMGSDRVFPPGYFRHKDLFSPEGKYGKWILEHDVVVKVGSTIFLHAGLDARHGSLTFRELRRAFRRGLMEYFELVEDCAKAGIFHRDLGFLELADLLTLERRYRSIDPEVRGFVERFERLLSGPVFNESGPIWYRGLAQGREEALARTLEKILEIQEAERIVVGHTQPAMLRIQARFAGKVILIDTGMNQAVYRGSPQALLLEKDASPAVISLP